MTEKERQIKEAQSLILEAIEAKNSGEKCYTLSESREEIGKLFK